MDFTSLVSLVFHVGPASIALRMTGPTADDRANLRQIPVNSHVSQDHTGHIPKINNFPQGQVESIPESSGSLSSQPFHPIHFANVQAPHGHRHWTITP